MTDYRKRLEDATDCCGAAREDDELVLVTVGDLRSLLSEAERLRVELLEASRAAATMRPQLERLTIAAIADNAEIKRLRSLVEEAGKVVEETEAFYDRVPTPHHPGETAILDDLSALRFKLKGEAQ